MASILKVDELQGIATANDITVTVGATITMSLEQGLAKCWLNYAGSGTTFNDSNGVSSATDNGLGDYTYSFTSNMSNANYAICATAENSSAGAAAISAVPAGDEQFTSSFNVENGYTSTAPAYLNFDCRSYASIFGDLA